MLRATGKVADIVLPNELRKLRDWESMRAESVQSTIARLRIPNPKSIPYIPRI